MSSQNTHSHRRKPEILQEEREIMELLTKAHNKYIKLKQSHPADRPEWVRGIHSLQHLIVIRMARRVFPDIFTIIKKE